jgi:hypothetical protein
MVRTQVWNFLKIIFTLHFGQQFQSFILILQFMIIWQFFLPSAIHSFGRLVIVVLASSLADLSDRTPNNPIQKTLKKY